MTHVDISAVEAEDTGRALAARCDRLDATGVPEPLASGVVTMSGEPASKWEALVHLEAIKVSRFASLRAELNLRVEVQLRSVVQCACRLSSRTAQTFPPGYFLLFCSFLCISNAYACHTFAA